MINSLKLLVRKYHTLSGLSAVERALLIRSLWLLPIVTIALQVKGLRFTQDLLLLTFRVSRSNSEPIESQIWTTVRMVKTAAKYYQPWANCLKKSLVLWILLRDRGIMSELRIGVQRESTTFSAHAWVEYQGIVLNDSDDVHQRFQAFDRLFEQPIEAKP
jgi:Transglutaminase-like superfamily